jgi:hypothetical protein
VRLIDIGPEINLNLQLSVDLKARGKCSAPTKAMQWSATSAIFFGRLLFHQSFGQYSSYFHQTNKAMIIARLL